MSQYFKVGDRVLWNPTTRVAQLFYRTGEVMVLVAERPLGIHDTGYDDYHVDPTRFPAFVDALAVRYLNVSHPILTALVEGFLPTALALLSRAGGTVPALVEAAESDPDEAIKRPGGLAAITAARRILALTAELEPIVAP